MKMWQNTQKQLKIDPSQAAWRACLADSRGQNVALGSAINQLRFHTNMWQNTHKSSWKSTLRSKNVAEHGRILIKKLHFYTKMWWNTQINYHAFHTKKWQNTQKHLKIDPSQGPNTMAWRVQPRRFSSMFIADTRCQNVALEYTINQLRFYTNMWRNTQKSSWKSTLRKQNVAEHGRILIKKLHFYTKMWPNTQINYENVAKHTKALENWSFAGPKHHGLACSTEAFFKHV